MLKKIIPIAGVLLVIIAGCKALTYMLIDDTALYARNMMHEFYQQDNIDVLFIGGSHCLRSIDPYVVDEQTGKNTFLACTLNQWIDASYALVKEAGELYDLDEVYLEMSASLADRTGSYKERESLTSTYAISDYMRPSFNKLNFLLNASSADHYINSFWPARRNWDMITDFHSIGTTLQRKSTSKYRDYSDYYVNQNLEGIGTYIGKGYTAISLRTHEHRFMVRADYKNIETDDISQDWINTLMDIIEFCADHKIKLTLFASPVSNFELSAKGNYDDYVEFIKDLVKDKDVSYMDFNLVKEEYFPYRQINYQDGDHLNMYGAELFSPVIADSINGDLPGDFFYNSVREKLEADEPDYYGVYYVDDYQTQNRIFCLVSNVPDYFEYQVTITTGDGESHLLQEYDINTMIPVPFEMIPGCELFVTYRPAGSSDEGSEINYHDMEAVY